MSDNSIAVKRRPYPRIAGYLHRRGIARILNSQSGNAHDRGSALIQAAGPKFIAEQFAVYALRHCPHIRFDWQTLTIDPPQQVSRWVWRYRLNYRRLR